MKKLKLDFFKEPTLWVAEHLLGKIIHFKGFKGIIIETEAYGGSEDPASHAFRGKTPRNHVMFGRAGFSYVYLIYGMYYCLNFVTEPIDTPGGVLIRGIKLLNKDKQLLNGPGKLCRALGITTEHYGIDLTKSNELYVTCDNHTFDFIQTSRIGIRVGTDKLWRFLAKL